MTIEAVLWDYGGVFTASPFGSVSAYARSVGADPVVFREMVFGSYDTDGDHPWHRCERGEITIADTWAQISAAVDLGVQGVAVDSLEIRQPVVAAEAGVIAEEPRPSAHT